MRKIGKRTGRRKEINGREKRERGGRKSRRWKKGRVEGLGKREGGGRSERWEKETG